MLTMAESSAYSTQFMKLRNYILKDDEIKKKNNL